MVNTAAALVVVAINALFGAAAYTLGQMLMGIAFNADVVWGIVLGCIVSARILPSKPKLPPAGG